MGVRWEDMQQTTTGRTQTWVTAFRTEAMWYALHPFSHRGTPGCSFLLAVNPAGVSVMWVLITFDNAAHTAPMEPNV